MDKHQCFFKVSYNLNKLSTIKHFLFEQTEFTTPKMKFTQNLLIFFVAGLIYFFIKFCLCMTYYDEEDDDDTTVIENTS